MKHIILGTAGHIDHGKTALIKLLTGIDCDRLKEEKERGITIELGFTSFYIPDDIWVGIIDVPGHERFVHHMVAGVAGIDVVLLVIAADEGIMPQTREHLDICRILGVKRGLLALTKIDLVDKEWLDLVREEINDFVEGTFLADAPIIPVSAITGEGLDDLICALRDLAGSVKERTKEGGFRLPIDRVFSMKGFGSVVTGTLLSGQVSTGDLVEILPQGIKARIRGIQVHNKKVETASAGQRTALNLQGINREEIRRGDVLCQPDLLAPSYLLDARLTLLENAPPVKNRARIRFHTGTAEILGRAVILDKETLKPGDNCLAQFRLEEKIAVMPHDRYVIRRYSPLSTLGGGEIIDSHPEKHKRFNRHLITDLVTIEHSSTKQTVELYVKKRGASGIDLKGLMSRTNIKPDVIAHTLEGLNKEEKVVLSRDANLLAIHISVYKELKTNIIKLMERFHHKNPLKKGISKEKIKSGTPPGLDVRFFNRLLGDIEQEGLIVHTEDIYRLTGHLAALSDEEQKACDAIMMIFKQAGAQPPCIKDVISRLRLDNKQVDSLLEYLVEQGELLRLKGEMFFYKGAIDDISSKVRGFLESRKEMQIADFKELTGLSRKYAVPILEYMDAQGITMRIDDKRVLRRKR